MGYCRTLVLTVHSRSVYDSITALVRKIDVGHEPAVRSEY